MMNPILKLASIVIFYCFVCIMQRKINCKRGCVLPLNNANAGMYTFDSGVSNQFHSSNVSFDASLSLSLSLSLQILPLGQFEFHRCQEGLVLECSIFLMQFLRLSEIIRV